MLSNPLIPELSVSSFEKSLDFYTRILGFSIAYDRPEEGFAFLVLNQVQIMIDEIGKGRTWRTALLDFPLGRGVNFQIEVKSIDPILKNLRRDDIPLFLDIE
ncbi:MAG: VOC family protein, partial [Chloroflexota bacterium]